MAHPAADDLARLARLERRMAALERQRTSLVVEAKTHGASWDAIAAALGTSRQSAWETYRLRVKQLLDTTAASGDVSEAVLLDSAASSLARARARRR